MGILGSDPYAALLGTPLGKRMVDSLGLPKPATLRRYAVDAPLLDGAALLGWLDDDHPIADRIRTIFDVEGIEVGDPFDTLPAAAVIVDLSGIAEPGDLERFRAVVAPSPKRLQSSGRVLVIRRPESPAPPPPPTAARPAPLGGTHIAPQESRARVPSQPRWGARGGGGAGRGSAPGRWCPWAG